MLVVSNDDRPGVIAWRRDFHQHPELGNRETRTAKVIADELRRLGYDVRTGVACQRLVDLGLAWATRALTGQGG